MVSIGVFQLPVLVLQDHASDVYVVVDNYLSKKLHHIFHKRIVRRYEHDDEHDNHTLCETFAGRVHKGMVIPQYVYVCALLTNIV